MYQFCFQLQSKPCPHWECLFSREWTISPWIHIHITVSKEHCPSARNSWTDALGPFWIGLIYRSSGARLSSMGSHDSPFMASDPLCPIPRWKVHSWQFQWTHRFYCYYPTTDPNGQYFLTPGNKPTDIPIYDTVSMRLESVLNILLSDVSSWLSAAIAPTRNLSILDPRHHGDVTVLGRTSAMGLDQRGNFINPFPGMSTSIGGQVRRRYSNLEAIVIEFFELYSDILRWKK